MDSPLFNTLQWISSRNTMILVATVLLVAVMLGHPVVAQAPPMSNFDVIEHFSSTYDIDGLHGIMSKYFQLLERNPDTSQVQRQLSPSVVQKGAGLHFTSRYKLEHDFEQAYYLSKHLTNETEANFFGAEVATVYKEVLESMPIEDNEKKQVDGEPNFYFFRNEDILAGIRDYYNKALHVTDFSENIQDENGNPVSILNKNLDTARIERQWFGQEAEDDATAPHPGIVCVDNLLSPEALARVRQIMLESTVWYETKTTVEGGYVGAYLDDGLYDRLLIAVGFELHKALPNIMKGHPMRYMWAYKYDERYSGIGIHADEAAVNVNIWLTPDDANLDSNSGGLVVYTTKPPESWEFSMYNKGNDYILELLKPSNFANVSYAYKQNRAVIFDSALFHKTDDFTFKAGYENRRINLTILYGKMQKGVPEEEKTDEL